MNHYSFTDEETVARISEQCPRAMQAYFIVLHNIDNQGLVTISRDKIVNMMKSWTKFKNDLRSLARLFIIDLFDDGDVITVSLLNEALV